MKWQQRPALKMTVIILIVIFSAAMYFLAFRIFINNEAVTAANNNQPVLFSSGVSGIALITSRLISPSTDVQNSIYPWLYFTLNIPVFILGFKSVGRKFTLYSLIHVAVVSILTFVVPQSSVDWLCQKASINFAHIDPLSLALFAGILSGISTGIVFKFGGSGGGMDIVVLYLAIKKGINSGHYMKLINAIIVIVGGLLLMQIPQIFYTVVYLFTSALIVDLIHIRNKKAILNVISTLGDEISEAVLASSRHSMTIFNGHGAYSKREKQMLYMVISSFEVDKIVAIIKNIDPNCFISISTASSIVGRFYLPPLE